MINTNNEYKRYRNTFTDQRSKTTIQKNNSERHKTFVNIKTYRCVYIVKNCDHPRKLALL